MSSSEVDAQSSVQDYGAEPSLGKWDFTIPGMGDPGPDCQSNRVPPAKAICPSGDSIRYEPLKCRRVECPDCYAQEQAERTMTIVLEVEAYAQVHDERPHAIVASVPPDDSRTWTYEKLNTSLARRAYRRMRSKCDVLGGYGILHAHRVPDARKKQLRQKGYGSGGSKGGYWRGVRNDALELGDWYKYLVWGPHLHSVGFPGRIDQHEGEDFLVKKYADLDTLEDVVGHVRYLLTHRAQRSGDDLGRSIRPWGLFHHASTAWDGAEEELSTEEYHALATRVAEKLGLEWDAAAGELDLESRQECPECGTPVEEFFDLWMLPELADGLPGVEPWMSTLNPTRRGFFLGLFEEWRSTLDDPESNGAIDLEAAEDLTVPDEVTVWSVKDHDPQPEVDSSDVDDVDAEDSAPIGTDTQADRREAIFAATAGSGATLEQLTQLVDADRDVLVDDLELLVERGRLLEDDAGQYRRN